MRRPCGTYRFSDESSAPVCRRGSEFSASACRAEHRTSAPKTFRENPVDQDNHGGCLASSFVSQPANPQLPNPAFTHAARTSRAAIGPGGARQTTWGTCSEETHHGHSHHVSLSAARCPGWLDGACGDTHEFGFELKLSRSFFNNAWHCLVFWNAAGSCLFKKSLSDLLPPFIFGTNLKYSSY